MQFLKQQFQKLCADMGLDYSLYNSAKLDKLLDKFIKTCARTELVGAQTAPNAFKTEAEQQEFIATFYNAVEIQAAILLDRLNLLVTGKEPLAARPSKPKTASALTADQSAAFAANLDATWQIVEQIKDFPGTPQELSDLLAALGVMNDELYEKVSVIHDFLLAIKNDTAALQLMNEKWEELLIKVLEIKQLPVPAHQTKQLKEYYEKIAESIQKYKDRKITATRLIGLLQGLDVNLVEFGMSRTQAHAIASEIKHLIDDIKHMRVDYNMNKENIIRQKETLAQGYELADKLPGIMAEEFEIMLSQDGPYKSLLDDILQFFTDKSMNRAQVAVIEASMLLQHIESLDSLCIIMRMLKINSVDELVRLGKDGLGLKLRQYLDNGGAAAITPDDFNVLGSRDDFMLHLLPAVVGLAIYKVSDTGFNLGDLCHALGLPTNDPVMHKMQGKVAKMLEWDFFVHHEQYVEYLKEYMRRNEIAEEQSKPTAKAKAVKKSGNIFAAFPNLSIFSALPKLPRFKFKGVKAADITSKRELFFKTKKGTKGLAVDEKAREEEIKASPSGRPRTPST